MPAITKLIDNEVLPHFPPVHSVQFVKKPLWGASFNPNHRYLELEQKGPHGNRAVIYQYCVRYTTRKGLLSRLYLLLFNFFFHTPQPSSVRFEGRVVPSSPTFLPARCVCVRPKTKRSRSRTGGLSAGRPMSEPGFGFVPEAAICFFIISGNARPGCAPQTSCCNAWRRCGIYWLLVGSCGEGLCNGGCSDIRNWGVLLVPFWGAWKRAKHSTWIQQFSANAKRDWNVQHLIE